MKIKLLRNSCFAALALFLALGFAPLVNAQEIMTNAEVVKMAKAGFGAQVIIAKVKGTPGKYDLSLDALVALKKEGVSDDVVAAMLEANNRGNSNANANGGSSMMGDPNDPRTPRSMGIYLYDENAAEKFTQLEPTVSAQNRTGGGFTAAITPFGLGKIKTKANLPGTAAKTQVRNSKPVFYFYLDAKSGGLGNAGGIPSTPNEFALVKFNIRSDNRELTIGKVNSWGAKGGLSDESVFQLVAEKIGEGIYKVTPSESLKNGEYGFFLINSGGSNTTAGAGSKFFDFGVNLR